MAIVLPHGLEPHEIRVLQEYRRLNAGSLPMSTLTAIRHPAGAPDGPVKSLVAKGFLAAEAEGESFALADPARDFLAIEAKPEFEEPPAKASAPAEKETAPAD